MPIYEYRCDACGALFETLVRAQDPEVACPTCGGGRVTKLFSTFGVSVSGGSARPSAATSMGACCSAGGCHCH